jgi:hypothetical protein
MTDEWQSSLNSVGVLAVGSALTFCATWYWNNKKVGAQKEDDIAAGHKVTVDRIAELESKLAVMTAAVVPISTAFQAILIKELTHHHAPEMDELMVKVGPPNTLTEDEEWRLGELLAERSVDMSPQITQEERDAASILPAVMARAKIEQEQLPDKTTMKMVSVPVELSPDQVEDSKK